MKLITLKTPNTDASFRRATDPEFKTFNFLCIENMQDAEYFTGINSILKSKQAINFWMGFKSQNFRSTPMDYLCHEDRESKNGIANVLALQMSLSEKPTSIADYCSNADKLIMNMNSSILDIVDKGKMVRVFYNGGYCPIENLEEYSEVWDINEQEAYNYLLHKTIDFKFEINKASLVIENDSYIPERLVTKFCDESGNKKEDIQIFTSFKHRTLLFKKEDYIKLFNDGITNGLRNIIFETTAQDQGQVNNIKQVFEYVMSKHPDKHLNIYARVYDKNKKLFTSVLQNINIVFL